MSAYMIRRRRLDPADPSGEPICLLTADVAHRRRAPIDRLLGDGNFQAREGGYEIRLPRSDAQWELANAFAEEEAACCPAFALEVYESENAIVVLAGYPEVPGRDLASGR